MDGGGLPWLKRETPAFGASVLEEESRYARRTRCSGRFTQDHKECDDNSRHSYDNPEPQAESEAFQGKTLFIYSPVIGNRRSRYQPARYPRLQ